MTVLFEPNEDALSVSGEQAANPPAAGFLASFEVAAEAQMRAASMFGIEYYMAELDDKQTRALIEAGVADPPRFSDTFGEDASVYSGDYLGRYMDGPRMYTGREDEVAPETQARIQEYDKRIAAIRATRPDLHLYTSDQMFELVKKDAQEAERKDQTQERTWGGTFGAFLGGTLASINPQTDPLNFATLGVGGAGKTALQRIAVQTGAQGLIEGINQVTGVQEQRDMLGLSTGFEDAAMRVGGAMVGGAAIQGFGEAVTAGAKRFFRNTPDDPAPKIEDLQEPTSQLALPPPDQLKTEAGAIRVQQDPGSYPDYLADVGPLSGIRTGTPRFKADLNQMTDALNKWDAPSPAMVRPRTADAVYPTPASTVKVDVSSAVRNNAEYQAARNVDPRAFERLEKLTERRDTFRRWIDELAVGRDADVSATITKIDARIAQLEARQRSVQGIKNKTDIKAQIKEARADKERLLKISEQKETPDIAAVRRDLMKTDEQMRDLAPVIGRAHAQARGEWAPDTETMDAVWKAYSEGRTDADVPPKNELPSYDEAVAMTTADRVPALARATPEQARGTPAETVSAVLADDAVIIKEALDAFRQTVTNLFGKEADGKLTVGEHEFDIDADRIYIPNEDGTGGREVSIREMLAENRETEMQLEAMQTCGIARRS